MVASAYEAECRRFGPAFPLHVFNTFYFGLGMSGTVLRTRIGTAFAILLFLAICLNCILHENPLVDAHVYSSALNTVHRGGDPYLEDAPLRFVCPPWFLLVPYLGRLGWFVYLIVNMGCLLSIPYLISRYLQGTWVTTTWCYLVFALAPTFPGEISMIGGNLANILYAVLLWSGLRGVRCGGRWSAYYAAVFLFASVKPQMLCFLLLPLLWGAGWIPSALTVASVGSAFAVQRAVAPRLFKEFEAAVHSQLITHGDIGVGIPSLFHGSHLSLPLLLHFFVVAFFALCMWITRLHRDNPTWISTVLVLCVLANPRLIHYDIAVATVPTFYVLANCFRRSPALAGLWSVVLFLLFSLSLHRGMLGLLFSPLAVYAITEWELIRTGFLKKTISSEASLEHVANRYPGSL